MKIWQLRKILESADGRNEVVFREVIGDKPVAEHYHIDGAIVVSEPSRDGCGGVILESWADDNQALDAAGESTNQNGCAPVVEDSERDHISVRDRQILKAFLDGESVHALGRQYNIMPEYVWSLIRRCVGDAISEKNGDGPEQDPELSTFSPEDVAIIRAEKIRDRFDEIDPKFSELTEFPSIKNGGQIPTLKGFVSAGYTVEGLIEHLSAVKNKNSLVVTSRGLEDLKPVKLMIQEIPGGLVHLEG